MLSLRVVCSVSVALILAEQGHMENRLEIPSSPGRLCQSTKHLPRLPGHGDAVNQSSLKPIVGFSTVVRASFWRVLMISFAAPHLIWEKLVTFKAFKLRLPSVCRASGPVTWNTTQHNKSSSASQTLILPPPSKNTCLPAV